MNAPIKATLHGIALCAAFPFALTAGFGRIQPVFRMWAHSMSLLPGLPGDYVRIAYYSMTLRSCPLDNRIEFGSFFAHPDVRLGHHVYIGSYCILGQTEIGDRTHIASGVQVLSGSHQHGRNPDGTLQGSNLENFVSIRIGADCWIGAASIVMAPLENNVTIGAGSVVTRPIPAGETAVGSPARPIQAAH